ncbi:hypothetical protein [Chlorogloeopsis sp. ULAP02]|uniref:hypothetical protein n=1 Tax=Chlorogloeopsis sp. ULAP02 TaxID=3107926 RepID=UPI003135935C
MKWRRSLAYIIICVISLSGGDRLESVVVGEWQGNCYKVNCHLISIANLAKAIAAFERTLISVNSPW